MLGPLNYSVASTCPYNSCISFQILDKSLVDCADNPGPQFFAREAKVWVPLEFPANPFGCPSFPSLFGCPYSVSLRSCVIFHFVTDGLIDWLSGSLSLSTAHLPTHWKHFADIHACNDSLEIKIEFNCHHFRSLMVCHGPMSTCHTYMCQIVKSLTLVQSPSFEFVLVSSFLHIFGSPCFDAVSFLSHRNQKFLSSHSRFKGPGSTRILYRMVLI